MNCHEINKTKYLFKLKYATRGFGVLGYCVRAIADAISKEPDVKTTFYRIECHD
jgi:hypothetical protein